ncbi:MAG: hypothetical protein ACREJ5_12065 [Geminicoccaceae bacterium]
MLNEFVVLERGLSAAGFSVTPRHPDVQSPGRSDALHVRLDRSGTPTEASFIKSDRLASLWTLRTGKHNSFPYVQLKRPLLSVPEDAEWHEEFSREWKGLSLGDRRRKLSQLAESNPTKIEDWADWPGAGLEASLDARGQVLSKLDGEAAAVSAVIARFLRAGKSLDRFIQKLSQILLAEISEADTEFIEVIRVAFVGKMSKQGGTERIVGAPLYFDVDRGEFARDVATSDHVRPISEAFQHASDGSPEVDKDCAYTGQRTRLHSGNFPQPTLPVLGQVYLFAKNEEIKAAHRYGRSADDAIPVSFSLMQRLAGALDELTAEHRKGQTWRSVPGERPKQGDLLLAFVDNALEAPLADAVADDGEDMADDGESVGGRADFLKRTERVIAAVKAKVGADFRTTPVTLCILRKVEPGNAKTILHRAFTVRELYGAAMAWTVALGNLPDWLQMPVAMKAGVVAQRGVPVIAPLQLPKLTRTTFIRAGREKARREPVGVTAQDALTLFLNESGAERVARVALRFMLERQGALCSGAVHALRKDAGADKLAHALRYDRAAALRALGFFGVLLAKVGHGKEGYMSDAAFKLGQLLAVADAVHVGYCTDVRGGDVPPTLLGNSVLPTAQSDPMRALAVLSRRWKPYAAWAKLPAVHVKANRLRASSDKKEQSHGWAMVTAVSQARRADELCRDLHGRLRRQADDAFRAELLLGYVAGLPRKSDHQTEDAA